MRARNIKPGLFDNEILGSADPLLTILFEGLWCMADREGRLEDRPLRICAGVFRYRRKITEKKTDLMLSALRKLGFIERYEVAGKTYIQVLEFRKHQHPHKNETASIIPPFTAFDDGPRPDPKTDHGQNHDGPSTVALGLIPDSGFRIPDSGLSDCGYLIPDTPTPGQKPIPPTTGPGVIDMGRNLTRSREEISQAETAAGEAWRDVTGVNPQAMSDWIAHLAALEPPKILAPHVRLSVARTLAGFGDAAVQTDAVKRCIDGQWRNLQRPDPTARAGPTKTADDGWRPNPADDDPREVARNAQELARARK